MARAEEEIAMAVANSVDLDESNRSEILQDGTGRHFFEVVDTDSKTRFTVCVVRC